jgi:hypothetical protein
MPHSHRHDAVTRGSFSGSKIAFTRAPNVDEFLDYVRRRRGVGHGFVVDTTPVEVMPQRRNRGLFNSHILL